MKYEALELEVVEFDFAEIITSSIIDVIKDKENGTVLEEEDEFDFED